MSSQNVMLDAKQILYDNAITAINTMRYELEEAVTGAKLTKRKTTVVGKNSLQTIKVEKFVPGTA